MRLDVRRTTDDAGFSLIELLVAMSIFVILIAIVSGVLITGVRSINSAQTSNTTQAQEENTLLWITQLLHYVDNPLESRTPPDAMLEATPSAMTFFTMSGTGTVDRQPYKVKICTTTRGIETFMWAPTLSNGVPVVVASPDMTVPACTDAGATGASRRLLVPKERDHTPSLAFRYWRPRTTADGAGTGDIELVPPLTAAQMKLVSKVGVTISDSELTVPLQQTVLLVNPR